MAVALVTADLMSMKTDAARALRWLWLTRLTFRRAVAVQELDRSPSLGPLRPHEMSLQPADYSDPDYLDESSSLSDLNLSSDFDWPVDWIDKKM